MLPLPLVPTAKVALTMYTTFTVLVGDTFPLGSTAYAATVFVPGTRLTGSLHVVFVRLAAVQLPPFNATHTFDTATLSVAVPFTVNSTLLHSSFATGAVTVSTGAVMSLKFATRNSSGSITNFKVAPLVRTAPSPPVQLVKITPLVVVAAVIEYAAPSSNSAPLSAGLMLPGPLVRTVSSASTTSKNVTELVLETLP